MAAFFHLPDPLRPNRQPGGGTLAETRPRVGIALSSGGAKGLAHIGVIQVLEENDIPLDAIVGTSMGAYVGGLRAAGLNGKELEKLAAEMTRRRDLWSLVDPAFPPRRGFVRGRNIFERLEKTLQGRTFADLKTPFRAVATEFESLERAVLAEGNVASAIVASLAVPGVVVPVIRDGIEYIDGGVCDPLPVRLTRETFAPDIVIGVNVLPPVGSLRRRRAPAAGAPSWKRGLSFANRHLNYFAHGNLLDILRAAAMGSQMRLVGRSARLADVLISPVSVKSGWHDYHRYAEYIAIGREAATRALPELQALFHAEGNPAAKSNPEPEVIRCV